MSLVRLGDVVRFVTGGTPPKAVPEYWDGNIPWISAADISQSGTITPRLAISEAGLVKSSTNVAEKGWVLVVTRTSVGKTAIVRQPTAISQDITALTLSDDFTPEYVRRFLESRESEIAGQARGATIKGVARSVIEELLIPRPPIEEQRRIAAILDQADAIRAKRREQLDELTKLYDATFVSLFSSEDFEQLRIAEIAKTSSGATPSRSNDTYWGGAIPWVKSGELHNRFVLSTEEHITENALRSSSVKLLEPGTVLLAMYGATAGAVSELAINATTNQAVCAISPGERVTSIYLASALRSAIDSLLHQRAGGAQPNLSQEKVREFKIPVPPIELQREFAAKVQKIDEQRRMIEAALERDNELFASLQEKAFSGGL